MPPPYGDDDAEASEAKSGDRLTEALELEHVIGFTGKHASTLRCHPTLDNVVLFGMGCNVVVQKADEEQEFLYGHDEEITALDVSSTGAFAATGQNGSSSNPNRDAVVIIWNLDTKRDVYQFYGIRGSVTSVAFSPDELFVVATGSDGSFYVWDMQTGEVVAKLLKCPSPYTSIEWNSVPSNNSRPEYQLLCTMGKKVLVHRFSYSIAMSQYKMVVEAFKMPAGLIRKYTCSALTKPADATTPQNLILGTSIGELHVYQVNTEVYRASMRLCSGGITAMCRGPDGIYIGGGDGTLRRMVGAQASWEEADSVQLNGSVTSLSFQSSGGTIRAGTNDGKIYTIASGEEGMVIGTVIQSEIDSVIAVSFSSKSSERFATMTQSGIVRTWNLGDYAATMQTKSFSRDRGTCMVYDSGVDQIITGWSSGCVRAFSDATGELLWEIPRAHKGAVRSVASTPLFYATGGEQGTLRLWSRSSRMMLAEFSDHKRAVTSIVGDVSAEHLLHSCGQDKAVFTYDLKRERRIMGHYVTGGGYFNALSQRRNGEFELVTASTDGSIVVWDPEIADAVGEIQDSNQIKINCVAVSPKTGKYVAVCTEDMQIKVWQFASPRSVEVKLVAIGVGHSGAVNALAWTPDEKQIVSAGSDSCLCVWSWFHDDDE